MLFSLGFCEILEHRNAEGDGGHHTLGRSMPIVLQEVQEDPFGRVVGNNDGETFYLKFFFFKKETSSIMG